MFSSRFMLFPTFNFLCKVPLQFLVKWEVVSNISSIPLFWFFISNVEGGNVFLAFYAIANISRKNSGIKKIKFMLDLDLFPTFCSPFTYWLNGRWFLQILDIGNFNMKLNGRWFPQIVDGNRGNLYPIYMYIYIQNCGVSFWTCWREISGDRVVLLSLCHIV